MLPTVYEKPLSLGWHVKAIQKLRVNCSSRVPHSGSNTINCMQLVQGFIQDFFPGRGERRCAQKAHACISAPTRAL